MHGWAPSKQNVYWKATSVSFELSSEMRVCFGLLLCSVFVSGGQEFPRGLDSHISDLGDSLAQQSHRNKTVTEERSVFSEQRNDGIHHKVTITKKIRYPYTVHVEKRIPKIVEVPVDKPFNVYVPKPYPVIVEKKVPYEIKVPQPEPYTVDKKVPYPVKVLVDKPYTLHVPKPYPVHVDKKYEFTVDKKVPVEVKVPVQRPYPVHVIVEKEVRFPVETKVPVPVKIPHEKPIPIYVTKHVPVHVDKPVPYTVEKVSTYPVKVPFRIPIKMHYPEGGSVEQHAAHFDLQSHPDHNLEWSEAMASVTKAMRNSDQTQVAYVRQGFGSSHFRHPQYFPSTVKMPFFYTGEKPKLTTKLQAVQQSYKVTESQSERSQTGPFLGNGEKEVMVPQILLGDSPSGNHYGVNHSQSPSQAFQPGKSFTVSNVVHHGHQQQGSFPSQPPWHHEEHQQRYHHHQGRQPSFSHPHFSQAHETLLRQPQVTEQNMHQLSHQAQQQQEAYYSPQFAPANSQTTNVQQNLDGAERIQSAKLFQPNNVESQKIHFGEPKYVDNLPKPQFGNRQPSTFQPVGLSQGQNHHNQLSHRVPSATYIQPPLGSQQSSPEAQNQLTSSRPAGSFYQQPNLDSKPLLPAPSQVLTGTQDDGISSSYVGSKTVLEGQELTYTSSVQHDQPTKKPETKT